MIKSLVDVFCANPVYSNCHKKRLNTHKFFLAKSPKALKVLFSNRIKTIIIYKAANEKEEETRVKIQFGFDCSMVSSVDALSVWLTIWLI